MQPPSEALVALKRRSPGINLLLFVVTLGVYWFVWLYLAFTEIAKDTGKALKAGAWVGALAVTHAAIITMSVIVFVPRLAAALRGDQTAADASLFSEPLGITLIGLSVLFYAVQLLYTRSAHVLVAGAAQELGLTGMPPVALAIAFNVLFMAAWIPFVGGLAQLGGLVVAIIWVIQIQGAMNAYWDRRVASATAPPRPPTFAPASQAPASPR